MSLNMSPKDKMSRAFHFLKRHSPFRHRTRHRTRTDVMAPKRYGMGWKPEKIDKELWAYYWARRDGLIEERPHEYWGPDKHSDNYDRTVMKKVTWKFEPVKWDRCYTGRGVLKSAEKPQWENEILTEPMPPKAADFKKPRTMLDFKKLRRKVCITAAKEETTSNKRGQITLDSRRLKKQDSSIMVEGETGLSKKRKLSDCESLRRFSAWAKQRTLRFAKQTNL